MTQMYLLCMDGDDPFDWHALSAGSDAAALQQEADRMEAAQYESDRNEWLASGMKGPRPMPLDDPKRNYRKYFVRKVAAWPAVDKDSFEAAMRQAAPPPQN